MKPPGAKCKQLLFDEKRLLFKIDYVCKQLLLMPKKRLHIAFKIDYNGIVPRGEEGGGVGAAGGGGRSRGNSESSSFTTVILF